MGRPPCCDKVGIKKGPWTPEEDIILVSYIQEHGPGNWRSVPTNTGLLRCSKSCRLRWTNYLRPGIKRGNFTPHEEGMIIHLQALLGNKWAAIASYLPERTDNDIKNYWNTHLKKKLKKFQSALDPFMAEGSSAAATQFVSKAASSSWMSSSSPKIYDSENNPLIVKEKFDQNNKQESGDLICRGEFCQSILSSENMNNVALDNSTCDSTSKSTFQGSENVGKMTPRRKQKADLNNNNNDDNPPLSFLEKWLLAENSADQMMELSSIF